MSGHPGVKYVFKYSSGELDVYLEPLTAMLYNRNLLITRLVSTNINLFFVPFILPARVVHLQYVKSYRWFLFITDPLNGS